MIPAGNADVSNSKSDQRGGTSRSSPTLGMCSRFEGANLEELGAQDWEKSQEAGDCSRRRHLLASTA